ncbi:penicillin-binding protein 1B [bacterium BMS3Abin12]|nr:penicillin-binding protein 1B [bacterium BMS3Abin12]
MALVALAYVLYLDHTIRSRFEAKRWSLPAQVYARPLDLYPGMALSARQFAFELRALGYRRVADPAAPATYARRGGEYRFVTREFTFWNGDQPAHRAVVRFAGGHVRGLTNFSGGSLALLRMDPVQIGDLYPSRAGDRILVRITQAPSLLVRGLVAVEDRGFYHNFGVEPKAILRAFIANLRAGRVVQGGSTITQQLVRNFFLSNRRSLLRKAKEAVMAILLDLHYRKRQILEAYINEVYLGQSGARSIHGFGLASRFYFDRPLSRLDAPRLALLIGLVKGPSYYDPRRHPRRALARRNLVLDVLRAQGVIGTAEAAAARRAPLGVVPTPRPLTAYPAFWDLMRRQLLRDYRERDLRTAGLRIFTTLDPLVQAAAERALDREARILERRRRLPRGSLQGAVVVTSVAGGEVLAVVGGREARYAGFNRALDAVRPVGSLIKPAVYLTALRDPRRYTLATLIDDAPIRIRDPDGGIWAPRNYDRKSHGEVPLYAALAHSYNQATVRLGMEVGAAHVVDTLHRMGIERPLRPYPSLFLGAVSLSPLEIARMYETLATGGFRVPLRAIRAILDADAHPLQRYPLRIRQVLEPAPAFLVDSALEKVVEVGTARGLSHWLPAGLTAAGKTGTTGGLRDSWFAGFTGNYLAVVWLGRDDNRPTGLSGAQGALRVWGVLMSGISAQPLRLALPTGVDLAWIDPRSGLRTAAGCAGAVQLPFIDGSIPVGTTGCSGGVGHWLRGLFR